MARKIIGNGLGTPDTEIVLENKLNEMLEELYASTSGGASWGAIVGTLSAQADLQAALDAKEDEGDFLTASQTAAGYQPIDSDLTQLAANITAFGHSLVDDANAAAARTTLGLGSVDNTSDASKPVSTATQTALNGKQDLDATLTALAGLNSTVGLVEQIGADSFTKRALGTAAGTDVLTRADGDGRYDALGAVATHEAAGDPHPQYLTATEANAIYDSLAATVSQAEAEAGAATAIRNWTAERVKQAILALAPGGGGGGLTHPQTLARTLGA